MTPRPLLLSLSLLSALSCPGLAQSQRVEIAIPASQDATLYEDSLGSLSNGGGGGFFVGTNGSGAARRTLLRFDINRYVPPDALIIAAELQLMIAQSQDASPRTVSVHAVEADWGEGSTTASGNGGAGAAAQAGDATWLHRFHSQTFWNQPGGDYVALPSAVSTMPTSGLFVVRTTTQMVLDLHGWHRGILPNYGWLLRGDEQNAGTARRLHSRETGLVGMEPVLMLSYMPAGSTQTFLNDCVGGNGLPFRQSLVGQPVGGSNLTLQLDQGVANMICLPLISLGISAHPVQFRAGCTLYLLHMDWPTLGFQLLDQAGHSATTYPIPQDPALRGSVYALQTLGFDQQAALGYVLSDAHLLVFR
jgi:hypothetical protein